METELEKYFDRLWPICRSITGNGLRESFEILKEIIPLQLSEIPTGTKVFDWEVPMEWNINEAYIITPNGDKICDFKINNLHVLNYSIAVNKEIEYSELEKHLYSLPNLPTAIPYVTSYYKENWGFCISHNEKEKLIRKGKYKVFIDSTLKNGSLTYGDIVLKGESEKEILFSSYLCHPSMANNELSGPLCLAFLYNKIVKIPNRKYTYRFVLAPETIGTIAYLAKYGNYMKEKIIAGYVLTCCGNEAPFVYKKSKHDNSLADLAAIHVLNHQKIPFNIIPFSVGGSDERQYCSPGFNFPVGSLTRSIYLSYKEYHTSLDNKDFISFSAMLQSIETYFKIIETIEINKKYTSKIQYCEPHLGKRGLYPDINTPTFDRNFTHRLLHFLSFADGENDLIEIAEKRKENALTYSNIIDLCKEKNII